MGLKKQTKLMAEAVPTIQPEEKKRKLPQKPEKDSGRASNRMLLLQSSDKRPQTSKTVHKLER